MVKKALGFIALLVCVGCAPCPRPGQQRTGLPPSSSSPALSLALGANVVAQVNATPATLAFTVEGSAAEGELAFAVMDERGEVVLRGPVVGKAAKIRLEREGGKALPPGIYRLAVCGAERADAAFEICHCTVYY